MGSKIREEGMKVFEKGLESFNQPEVWAGLAGDLGRWGRGLWGWGPGGIQRHGTPQIGGGAKAREALWQRMSDCMDQLHLTVLAIWHLQRVLSKKRDPFTHVLLLDEVIQEGDPMLTDRVWDALVKSFASQMKSVFTASSFVKEIFTVGYPKLLSLIENLLERISRDTDVKEVPPALTLEGKEQMIAAIEIFQTAFLALCLSRLSDLVNSVFSMSSRGSVPSKEHISRIISRIQEEIEAVQSDAHLTLRVLREISKVLLLFAERAEYQISTGPEARQISGPATPAQLKNFMLCQHLQEVHKRVTSIISGLPSVAVDVLSAALGTIYGVAGDSVTSLFQAMLDRLESCVLQIHDQNFGSLTVDAAMDNNASPYMEDLQKNVHHFRTEFLSRLLPSSGAISAGTENICTRLVRSMASRVLVFFIRHASLVRPLSESGKLRMARDMAELELAVGQNLFPVEQLGAPYRALRAFRPVIFLETSQLGSSPLLNDLPPSVVLHHLYSRAPEDLQSPLQRNKLTPLQYSLWMDSQGEDQIWKGVKATLDDYAANIRARGDKEFSPVYPLMMKVGSSVMRNES
ncbi:conserved oligomeric golgi complex subunit 5 [Phtheirospermum japonicum]|uniref:Conserved oligomeric golgi complex subunit 5 n=1 Tax=Phtheirospermum japonicum TaxID=374723 RepID=A0A830D147_9LAMI|nr:conserved oligomeric golgi complex subunit 5 [Phtheirospermum japonicum]